MRAYSFMDLFIQQIFMSTHYYVPGIILCAQDTREKDQIKPLHSWSLCSSRRRQTKQTTNKYLVQCQILVSARKKN